MRILKHGLISQKLNTKLYDPSMAIATIKQGAQGRPRRAKYCIVALGNLDSHQWTKQDCFAPIMFQLEL